MRAKHVKEAIRRLRKRDRNPTHLEVWFKVKPRNHPRRWSRFDLDVNLPWREVAACRIVCDRPWKERGRDGGEHWTRCKTLRARSRYVPQRLRRTYRPAPDVGVVEVVRRPLRGRAR